MNTNWEREYSINDALQKGIDVCKELNITANYENIGNVLHTEYVELFDRQGNRLTSGVGKGGGIKSKVGALFESLEHYLTEYKIDYLKQKLFLLEEIPNINQFEKEKIIQLLYSDSNREKLIPCQKYTLLKGRSENLWYPTFITNPFYADNPRYPEQEIDYSQLKRYSSNSGTAIGCSLNEALIHAINEVIERDALSLFLLEYYYYRNNKALRLINRDSLPIYLQEFLTKAEEELHQEIELIDITTEINVPVILAILKENNMAIPLYGAGSSLYRDYAIIRAISELVQSNHVIHTYPGAYKESVENMNHLKGFPDHYICAEFNTNTLLQAFEIEYIDFKKINNYSSHSLDNYLKHLIQLLNKQNFNIYYSILNKFNNDVHLVNVIIPNTERFFNVLLGQIVFPSDRGKSKNNAIDQPIIDYNIRLQHELMISDKFSSNNINLHDNNNINMYIEPYYSRQNLFLLKTKETIFCGRKIAESVNLENNTLCMTSAINTNMILGYFHTYQINDKEVYLYYTPCTQQKISEILSMLTDDTSAEITFPFSTLDDVLQEYLVTSKAWDSLDTEQLTNLDHDELHFRNITANYLYNQETSQKVFYDPACSTGTFLGHLKQLFPSG
ncbi:hypothetical protein BK704_10765, partial [[Bacillus thuringiensis] serovar konkukian]